MKSNTRIYFVPVAIGATPKVSDQFAYFGRGTDRDWHKIYSCV